MPLDRPSQELNVALLSEKCSDFAKFQIWPLRTRLDARAWLGNFQDDDLPLARHLLNAFMYFNDDLTRQLFVAALQGIGVLQPWRARRRGNIFDDWSTFLQSASLTYVTGEIPNPADSGHLFARAARDHAGVSEEQILNPVEALERIAIRGDRSPVVFVDDFVGSGDQFTETWERRYDIGGKSYSFSEAASDADRAGTPLEVYYAPAVCTMYGLDNIKRRCPGVEISAGNILDQRYNVFHPDSLVWPAELVADGQALVRRLSVALGLPEDESEWGLFGYHGLGLAIGFAHKTPDATIPLFRYRAEHWRPLVKDV
ncbi:phosphoribosyltransferase-like protein [Sphingomonas sp.]|uniref:phosphoribosyltransferase-like protein n=1 Tax=Sphingomonas sp. TaxID=28214 RepID=UPI002E31F875|nr:hypothetical protein [Sphingomonas sp.]HEX4693557.1 hypothetical protein [Sphingomonas sp.]